jgi:hypothetical protein
VVPARRIAEFQNTEQSLTLLRAAAVAHRHTQFVQSAVLVVSVLVAGLSLLNVSVPAAGQTVVLIGALWATTYAAFVVPWAGRQLRVGATLQEMFDVRVLDLPWNAAAAGDPVSEDEVSRLSRRFRRNPSQLRDYYLVADVPSPYDLLFCLEQNLAWGSRIRRRYANVLATTVAAWSGLGIVRAIITGSSVGRLASDWFVPSLGLLLLCLDIYRVQVSVTRERSRVLSLLRAAIDDSTSPVLASRQGFTGFARQIQDVLFQLRQQQPRVPTWFFRRFRDSDRADFRFKMHALEARVGNATNVLP